MRSLLWEKETNFPSGVCVFGIQSSPSPGVRWGSVACTSQGRLVLPSFPLEAPPPGWSSYSTSPEGPCAVRWFLAPTVISALCERLPPISLLLRFWQLPLLFPRDGCGIASGDICACNLLTQPRRRENNMVQRWGG